MAEKEEQVEAQDSSGEPPPLPPSSIISPSPAHAPVETASSALPPLPSISSHLYHPQPQTYDPFANPSETILIIRQIVRTWCEAVNNRQLDFDLPVWSNVSPHFKVDQPIVPLPSNHNFAPGMRGVLQAVRFLVTESPDFHVKVSGVDVYLEAKWGTATVFVNQVIQGHPKGIVRNLTGVVTLEWWQGRWVMVKFETPTGMNGVPGFW